MVACLFKNMKYIVITGGVISGLGKGITSSSIGSLFKSMGLIVTMMKIDPYLNTNVGMISHHEHGECFILSDGTQCDLDLGNYERALDIELEQAHSVTSGRIYKSVFEKESKGYYDGATIQTVPHITNEFIEHIKNVSNKLVNGKCADICLIEIGGTIGDIEVSPCVEAIQNMHAMSHDDKFCFIHVAMAYVTQTGPLNNSPEVKTKPIQHSISALRSRGISPHLLVVRSSEMLSSDTKNKLAVFCQMNSCNIISNPNVKTIYHVPGVFSSQNICTHISKVLDIECRIEPESPFSSASVFFDNISKFKSVTIGILKPGQGDPDVYLSIVRSIEHASFNLKLNGKIIWITDLCDVKQCNTVVIPGSYQPTDSDILKSICKICYDNDKPLLAISNGLLLAFEDIIEINTTPIRRLGSKIVRLKSAYLSSLYGKDHITERFDSEFDYRINIDNDIVEQSAINIDTDSSSVLRCINHKYYVGCQYNPQFRSSINNPHPLFVRLLQEVQ